MSNFQFQPVVDPTGAAGPPGPTGATGATGAQGVNTLSTYPAALGNGTDDIGSAPGYTCGALVVPTSDILVARMLCWCTAAGAGAGDLRFAIYSASTAYTLLASSAAGTAPVVGVNSQVLSTPYQLTKGLQYYFAIFSARSGATFKLFATSETNKIVSWYKSGGTLWAGGAAPTGFFDPFWIGAET